MRARLVPLLLLALPAPALAHPGRPPEPHDLWTAWSLEPLVLLAIGAAALAYRRGLRALWARAGRGRGVREAQAWAYCAGLLALVLALVTPLDPLGNALFTGHMVQHLVLTLAAGPLLALGAPLLVLLWALPPSGRRAVQGAWHGAPALRGTLRTLVHPAAAWILHAAVLWTWHVPALYDRAVAVAWVHALEHATMLLSAVLFWWVILPRGGALRHAPALGILYLFTFGLQAGMLGAVLSLGSRLAYSAYLATAPAWGLTPLEDQQLGGSIMKFTGTAAYVSAAGILLVLLLRRAEQRALRRDGLAPHGPAGALRLRALPLDGAPDAGAPGPPR